MGKKGRAAFEEFYTDIFGMEWRLLSQALNSEPCHCSLGPPLLKPYHLDAASKEVVRVLSPDSEEKILDICAAPGGKSLTILQMKGYNGRLTANDISVKRRLRLKRVLEEHLPASLLERVTLNGYDGIRWPVTGAESFDKVLLDAPCSSERHFFQKPLLLKTWGKGRLKRIQSIQLNLLYSVLRLVKNSGIVIYSTCALNPAENDGIVEKAIKKSRIAFKVLPTQAEMGRPTRYGWQILPHIDNGSGPMYWCKLQKIGPKPH